MTEKQPKTKKKKRNPTKVEATLNSASLAMYRSLSKFFMDKKRVLTYFIGYGGMTKTMRVASRVDAKFAKIYTSERELYIRIHAVFDLPLDKEGFANKFVIAYGNTVIESFMLKPEEMVDHYNGTRIEIDRVINCNLIQQERG